MIGPADIRRKAERLYGAYLTSWLEGAEFFPRAVPCNRRLSVSLADAAASVQQLRDGSKESLGYGYAIEWEDRNSRRHGRNRFPRKITFESADDLLRLIGKQREFASFASAVKTVRSRRPQLESWMRANPRTLIDSASVVDGLLDVVDYLVDHPRPALYGRELPLSVDTKFTERHERLLRTWLDIVLPPEAIAAHEDHFARRFGLKYAEPLIHIRFLDPETPQASSFPFSDFAVPLHGLSQWEIDAPRVIVVENKTNLLTLPPLPRTLGIHGMGFGITDLRYVEWLQRRELWYWGDLDLAGFGILSRFRAIFPHVRSVFMDSASAARWASSFGVAAKSRLRESLPNLTAAEESAYEQCALRNLCIEQDKIPQAYLVEFLCSALNER